MDIFPLDDDIDDASPRSPTASQVMMHLSVAAVAGVSAPKTFSLSGDIQGMPLSILVDSLQLSHVYQC